MGLLRRRARVAAGLAMSVLAAAALAGGSLAALTDSTAAPQQILTTGTVNVDTAVGGNWNQNLSNLAVGDTADRAATLTNTSTLPIGTATVTAKVVDTTGEFGGKLSDALTVSVTEGTGSSATTIVSGVRLADFTGGYTMTFPGGLAAATDAPLNFHYVVAGARSTDTGSRTVGVRSTTANPDNKFQGSSLSVTYTVNAVQRAGNGIASAPKAAPTVSSIGSSTATVSFSAPAGNPAGTTYKVYAVQDPTKYRTTTTGSAMISGLTPQTSYSFAVVAIAPSGNASAPSPASATITTLPVTQYAFGSSTAKMSILEYAGTGYSWTSYTPVTSGSHVYSVGNAPVGTTPLANTVTIDLYRVNANGSLTWLDTSGTFGCCGQNSWNNLVAGQQYLFRTLAGDPRFPGYWTYNLYGS